ncbi:Glucosamine 6-phosphate N-acetyltransferase [Carpediemonas membranifera]|uniref:Glucosamine 6-phosphate N-acetyltransferase n=1 Tax=Carpediemonas membranifera TaxID=201153 RepID=A0A8J6B3V2_9EUKA|nr:Glucosamine 6-phosphate N-acetyltransferase [Carpediemonas membranifera]|eukprot:KAG9392372.1 Glucosamine 6-phosphate N-acetyltransferase [Carpediemonas membranifera]
MQTENSHFISETTRQFESAHFTYDFTQNLGTDLIIRMASQQDFYKDHTQLLAQLTDAPEMTFERYYHFLHWSETNPLHAVLVVESTITGKVVASGTIFAEPKLIRGGSLVGHIEDIVVDTAFRGRGLGKVIVKTLIEIGREMGCYKTILACSDKNVGFYERCGMNQREAEMAVYYKSFNASAAASILN